jgi:hypothetical protein
MNVFTLHIESMLSSYMHSLRPTETLNAITHQFYKPIFTHHITNKLLKGCSGKTI